jgi:putative phage-type endonuclease
MIVYKEMEQRSEEWLQLRLGTITGTRLKDVFKSNNLPLIDELIAEELTGLVPPPVFVNDAMQRGIDLEPVAMDLYIKENFVEVETPAFVRHSDIEFLGFSPDGLVKEDDKYIGGVEIKCPSSKKHIEYIRINRIPNEYKYQILSYFINTEVDYVDFISYDDRVTVKPFHCVRVTREDYQEEIDKTVEGINKFNEKRNKYFKEITE